MKWRYYPSEGDRVMCDGVSCWIVRKFIFREVVFYIIQAQADPLPNPVIKRLEDLSPYTGD